MVESNAVPDFLPSINGLHFANSFPPGPTVTFGPFDPRVFGIGDASAGLCGGMSWYVRERFAAKLPIPPDTEPPANGSPLFQALVRRQVLSLDWLRTPLAIWWMGAVGAASALQRTRFTEIPKIRADIDKGDLAMLGLVRATGWSPLGLTRNHQVLAYAYEADGDTTTLRICDPNWPGRDDVTITIGQQTMAQSTGEAIVGCLDLS
ncbi:MAG TPA: hypothetical protein VGQ31_06200 [Candidatus Limnocylindrales bacterium]|nr:hypothetical protein [Candidatus Limnocylindrales bacterium]